VVPFQNWRRDLNSTMHHPTNTGVMTTPKPKAAGASRTHFYLEAHWRAK